jgi:hypothetical protein
LKITHNLFLDTRVCVTVSMGGRLQESLARQTLPSKRLLNIQKLGSTEMEGVKSNFFFNSVWTKADACHASHVLLMLYVLQVDQECHVMVSIPTTIGRRTDHLADHQMRNITLVA